MRAIEATRVNHVMSDSLSGALAPVEYGFYFAIFYTVFGPILGLILMGGIGTGFLLIPVLVLCMVVLGPLLLSTIRTAGVPLACGASHLFIQLVVHDEPMYGMYIYQFGPWLISLVIIQVLAMHRPGFLHRFGWFTMFIGLAMLPFMSLGSAGAYERLSLDSDAGGVFTNPNALASWFGFCVLYFTIKGYIEKRGVNRLTAWIMAVGALYIVALTVSRGAIIALAVSLLVASRRLLKVGLVPLLLLAVVLLGLLQLGVFDHAVQSYTQRGGEETGRLQVWPLFIEKFLNSPLMGVGASHAHAAGRSGKFFTPHNGFLLFAVASGIVPLLLFCIYFIRSGMRGLYADPGDRNSVFYLPLVTYTGLITFAGNMDFMAPWAGVSLAMPLAVGVTRTESEARTLHTSFRQSETV
jgi:O-antigen ligase